MDGDEVVADVNAPGVGNEIAALQFVNDVMRRQARLRETVPVELDVHHLGTVAKDVDLRDVLHEQQLAAKEFRDIVELRVAEFLAIDSKEHAEHVAEVVDDH